MISALLYLQYHSVKNRLTARIKRLKQPKYLVGAIVGGAYFYFYFFHFLFHANGHGQISTAATLADVAFYESAGALIFFVVILLAWIIPHGRAALTFTEAEVAFLFPAPITRKGLIHFKLLRSQTAILFTTLFLVLIFNRYGGHAWMRAAGWWLILSTINLHLIGSSFARTMLLDRGITNWQRRIAILLLVTTLLGTVIVWMKKTMPGVDFSSFQDPAKLKGYIERVLQSGPLPYLLYPFRLVIRPRIEPDTISFLKSIGPALLVLLAHYAWVVRSDVAFEEASVDASRKLAEKIASVRAGNRPTRSKNLKPKRAPFTLAPTGSPPVALLWKNLIHAGQAFTSRVWITLVAVAIGASVGFRHSGNEAGFAPVVGTFALIILIWSLLLGPQVLRQDLRQDLLLADVLKLYPLPGWQIALGELLGPAAILTGIQWCLLIVAIGFFPKGHSHISWPLLAGCGLGAAMVLPALDLISLLIPNAAVLLFPAWFQMGKESPRGIEATGQRLISMLGQLVVFALAVLPAAIAFLIVFLVAKLALGPAGAVPISSLAATIVLAVEVGLGVQWLGRLFERFDLSAELTG